MTEASGPSRASVGLGLLVGALFMALAFRGVPLQEVGDAFREMDPRYLIAMTALFAAQELLRALRQWVLLRPVAPEMSLRSSLSIFFLSFFCIHVFPARAGELVRPYLLWKREGVSPGSGLGMVVAERAIDLVAALCMLWALLLSDALPAHLSVAGVAVPLWDAGRALGVVTIPLAVAGCLGLAFFEAPMLAFGQRLADALSRLSPRLRRPSRLALSFAAAFARGFASFRSPARLAAITALTATTWATTACIYLALAPAFGIGAYIGYIESVGIMVITMLGSLLPSPPGMAGVQEAFGRGALALFGVSGPELDGPALAYAITVHWYQVLLQALAAAWFFWRDGVTPRDLSRGALEIRG